MSAAYVREHYRVPAKRGARIRFSGLDNTPRNGTIVAFKGQYLRVRFDDSNVILTLHPTWKVEYLEAVT